MARRVRCHLIGYKFWARRARVGSLFQPRDPPSRLPDVHCSDLVPRQLLEYSSLRQRFSLFFYSFPRRLLHTQSISDHTTLSFQLRLQLSVASTLPWNKHGLQAGTETGKYSLARPSLQALSLSSPQSYAWLHANVKQLGLEGKKVYAGMTGYYSLQKYDRKPMHGTYRLLTTLTECCLLN